MITPVEQIHIWAVRTGLMGKYQRRADLLPGEWYDIVDAYLDAHDGRPPSVTPSV